ncbi:transthyretin-like family protein [Lacunimicrobium album]|jgi:hypothetical protein
MSIAPISHRIPTFGLLFVVAMLSGCGPRSGLEIIPVDGVVTLQGQPLSNALVTFYPQSGRSSSAKTDSTGHFDLKYSADKMGAVVGTHEVHITYGGPQPPSQAAASGKSTVTSKPIPPGDYKSPEPFSVTESSHHFEIKIP